MAANRFTEDRGVLEDDFFAPTDLEFVAKPVAPAWAPPAPESFIPVGRGAIQYAPSDIAAFLTPTGRYEELFKNLGWTGGDPNVYETVLSDVGESGTSTPMSVPVGATPEFQQFLKEKNISMTMEPQKIGGRSTVMVGGVPVGQYQDKVSGFDRLMSPVMDAVPGIILGVAAPYLAAGLGGGLLGAAGAGAITGATGAKLSDQDPLKGALKGAFAGGIGSLATPYIGQAAQAAKEAVGPGMLGDIASRAVSGAGTSALGAAVSGKDIGEALLSGGLSGAAGAATSGLVGDLGLPEPMTRVATTALTSALLGQDIEKAITNAIKGEVMSALKQPVVTDTGDETDRLIARYGTAEQARERENAALDDLMASLAPSPEPLPRTGVFELEELLAQPEEKPVGMTPVEREKFLEANIEDPLELLLARPTEEVDWASVYATPSVDPETGQVVAQAPTPEELAQYPGLTSVQDFGTAPQSDINKVYEDIVSERGGFASTWQTVGSDRVQIQDDGSAIGINTETGETYSLDDKQVNDMVDKGLLNTAESGYDAAIGKEPPAPTPAPAPAAKPPAPAPAPAAKSEFDPALLFALASMFGQQQQKPEEYRVADVRGARSPFGSLLDETGTQDDLLRILRG